MSFQRQDSKTNAEEYVQLPREIDRSYVHSANAVGISDGVVGCAPKKAKVVVFASFLSKLHTASLDYPFQGHALQLFFVELEIFATSLSLLVGWSWGNLSIDIIRKEFKDTSSFLENPVTYAFILALVVPVLLQALACAVGRHVQVLRICGSIGLSLAIHVPNSMASQRAPKGFLSVMATLMSHALGVYQS